MSKISVTSPVEMQTQQRQATIVSPLAAVSLSAVDPVVGSSVDGVRGEIDDAFADMRTFHNREPDEVFRLISGHSARLAELRGRIARVEGISRHWGPVRAREVEPALDELQKQYLIASRQLTVRELDWRMETGAR